MAFVLLMPVPKNDDQLKDVRIDVESRAGRVTLTGSVDSQEHASRAEQIARSTEGVKEVDNRLEAAYSSYGPIRREASCPIAENWPC